MRYSTFTGIPSHSRDSSPDTTTVKTLTAPAGTSAFDITVETTNARVTLDGSDPSAVSAASNVYPKDSAPVLKLLPAGTVVKWVSTAGTASVVQICWFKD